MANSESHVQHALRGAARLLDLGGRLGYEVGDWYELYKDLELPPEVADALAVRADWATVGSDLRTAMTTVDRIRASLREELARELLGRSAPQRLNVQVQSIRAAVDELVAAGCADSQSSEDEDQMQLFDKGVGTATKAG